VNERLKKLQEIGQSVWVDSLSRDDIQNGNLQRMMEDGVLGVTSNPTIFQQAIAQSELYDEELQELAEKTDDAKEIFRRIAVRDIQDACDIFMPVYDQTEHRDGYVSLEVAPELAFDTEGTITRARLVWEMVDRPNLLVKIPATKEGLPAIEESIAAGISVNVTLIFSLERYRAVAQAYIRGLERLVEGGGDPSKVASVASFFVSRVDTETDRRLEEVGREPSKGQTRHRQRQDRLPGVQEDFQRPQVGVFGVQGGHEAAAFVGFDLDQDPGVQGHHLRGQPHRPRDGQHHAPLDPQGDDEPRRGPADAR
jgi:transaldolase